MLLVLLLSLQIQAREFYLQVGQHLRLGNDVVYCGTNQPLPTCEERCQYFDNFNNSCFYQTRCEYSGSCLKYTSCEKFDTHENLCMSEKMLWTCSTGVNSGSCTETCQHFDNFENKCSYRTRCEIQGNCIKEVTCARWDDFEKKCLSEKAVNRCF